jgi:hypothetical protein
MARQFDRGELYRLARLGAEARLAALEAERSAILLRFPDLGGTGRRPAAASAGRPAASRAKRPYRMSAAARKAVSARMKKYWASRRKSQSKSS